MFEPNASAKPEPEPKPDAQAALAARTNGARPVAAEAYTALPMRGRRKPLWALWAALAVALAFSALAARRAAAPHVGGPAAAASPTAR